MKPARMPAHGRHNLEAAEIAKIAKINELLKNETFCALVNDGLQESIAYQRRRIKEEEAQGGLYTEELLGELELTERLWEMMSKGVNAYRWVRKLNRMGHPVLYINCATTPKFPTLEVGEKAQQVSLSIQYTKPDQPLEEGSTYYKKTPEEIFLMRRRGDKISMRLSYQMVEKTEEGIKSTSGPGIVITLDENDNLEIQRLRRIGGETYIIPREDSEPLVEEKIDHTLAEQLRKLVQELFL